MNVFNFHVEYFGYFFAYFRVEMAAMMRGHVKSILLFLKFYVVVIRNTEYKQATSRNTAKSGVDKGVGVRYMLEDLKSINGVKRDRSFRNILY